MNTTDHTPDKGPDEQVKSKKRAPFRVWLGRFTISLVWSTLGKWTAVTLIGLFATLAGIAYTAVHDDELVIVTSFGRISEGPLKPGIYWYMPYFNVIRRYTTTRQFLLITDKTVEANKEFIESHFQDGISVNTSDRVPVMVVLEVSYCIEKNTHTVQSFVRNFGRSPSNYGTDKIEKLIADICRNAARSVLANSKLTDIESDVESKCAQMRSKVMGSKTGQISTNDTESLGDLGISIRSLGYRVQPNPDIQRAQITETIKFQQEQLRKQTIEARSIADEKELELKEKLAVRRLETAKAEREAFEMSVESTPQKLRMELLNKWDGKLPGVLLIGEDTSKFIQDVGVEAIQKQRK
jgi:regulator of protease activity HflC (stomatin/prohibitin superfamily)